MLRLRENVLVETPHVQSRAQLICLNHELGLQCAYHNPVFWLDFKQDYLNQLKQKGDIRCWYCGVVMYSAEQDKELRLITVDHLQPLSAGGSKYDTNNLVPACRPCNQTRGTTPAYEYILSRISNKQRINHHFLTTKEKHEIYKKVQRRADQKAQAQRLPGRQPVGR